MNSEQIEKKRQGEIRLISEMISLYCKKKHGGSGALCEECKALSDYAISRIARCPFMEKRVSAVIARYTAIRRKCGRRFGRSCG